MREALLKIVHEEQAFRPPDYHALDLRQQVELKARLKKWELRQVDGEEVALEFFNHFFGELAEGLPKTKSPSPLTIPLIYALPDPKPFLDSLILTLFEQKFAERDLFTKLSDKLYFNLLHASGIEPYADSKKKRKWPSDSDESLEEIAYTYFRGTPLYALFLSPVPLKLTHRDRFNHTHVLGGTGVGKTCLLERLILYDFIDEEQPSLVVIDPHGDLIKKLTRTAGLGHRLILIDPRDTQFPVALNPLAVNRERLARYDQATREQVAAGVIQTFGYLWGGLTSLTLTGKQEVFFRYVTRLLLTLPEVRGDNATILDMLRLMTDIGSYRDVIEQLSPIQREFFEKDFSTKTFEGTREQIRYRIQAIIESPTMERLFTAPETKVDFFTELNRGSIILVDTAKDFLKEGSAVFGKLMISLILQAVLERAALPENERKPTFLMVDEAGSFFSQNIDDLLTEARKYKCGLVLAHQYLDQATGSLRASLAANTGIKFASGLSAGDASIMAREMRCSTDFILEQPRLQFAAHIRNVTPQAVSIPTRPIAGLRQLSDEEFERLIETNRAKVSLAAGPAPRFEQAPIEKEEIRRKIGFHSPTNPDDEWVQY